MLSENAVDTLCVIHQSTDFDAINLLPAFQLTDKALILTSHKLFPHEISWLTEKLNAMGKVLAGVICFGDFLEDKSLAACDDQASAELLPLIGSNEYIARYQIRMTELKNQALLEAVSREWQFDRIIVSEGPGISSSIWLAAIQDTSLVSAETPSINLSAVRLLTQSVWARITRPFRRYELVKVGNEVPIFFYSSVSRLKFRSGISVEPLSCTLPELKRHLSANKDSVLATTIHDYQPDGLQNRIAAPFEIYIDGLHPANMPRSYLDGYPDACYVVRDMFDNQWFSQFGKRTKPGRDFLASSEMALPSGPGLISTVYLMLNHAGDWMALINRSDTDLLLLAFVELARAFPTLQFVVRPHPGTAHADHEGVGAINRIRKLISVVQLGNLEVSGDTLEQDLAAADLIVSEYSNVLVEGWRMGIPGLIVNLTGRRNFMQDYSEIGFSTVSSEAQLYAWLTNVLAHPEEMIQLQTRAATGYNQRLALFMGSA